MKKYILFLVLIAFQLSNAQVKIEILSVHEPVTILKFRLINNTKKKIIIFDNSRHGNYLLFKNENTFIGYEHYSIDELDAGNYQHNFSQKKIKNIQKKYKLSYENAVYFLERTKSRIVIEPFSKRIISLEVFNYPTKPNAEPEKTNYYIEGKVTFNTEYFPKQFMSNLEKNNYSILEKIDVPKTKIDVTKLFLNEVRKITIPDHLRNKFKYDENGRIVPIND